MSTNQNAKPTASFTRAAAFTESAFIRSHGKRPSRSTYGSWAFQRTTRETAYDSELRDGILWFKGTLPEAKKALKAGGHTGYFAILP